ncbi:uncharacterized protein FIBRA_02154 [Fibroporia radiculosa]|uniref:Uncharacterized protein n=1 Tax=Fibroporia radiculosa TaxID=599839 RepID=J4HUG0_9APHY|nr:uncharacterized protein FIBRA_02154 [Fibroporia radiculosa]CCM00127.1 predicted protein [Fibroporia radiculosa]
MLRSRTPKQPSGWARDSRNNSVVDGSGHGVSPLMKTRKEEVSRKKLFRVTLLRSQALVRLVLLLVILATISVLWLLYLVSGFKFAVRSGSSGSHKNNLPPRKPSNQTVQTKKRAMQMGTPTIQIPMVTRSIMQKLHDLHVPDGFDEVSHTGYRSTRRWPPIVTVLPEVQTSAKSKIKLREPVQTTEEIDSQFCAGGNCRLLLPLLVTERDPKTQAHLVQLLTLAKTMNRTLVLPNVGRGRAGACLRWDYTTYFDLTSTMRLGIERVMMMDNFRTWIDMRPLEPTGQIVFIDENTDTDRMEGQTTDSAKEPLRIETISASVAQEKLKGMKCLATKFHRLKLDSSLSIRMHPTLNINPSLVLADTLAHWNVGDTPELTKEGSVGMDESTLVDKDGNGKNYSAANVLLLYWNLHQQGSKNHVHLDYSTKLRALASELTVSLTPYLAVRWHMKKAPSHMLLTCADALIDALDTILHDEILAYGIQAVWLWSDYPVASNTTSKTLEAETTKGLLAEHAAAIEVVRDAFLPGGELAQWKLTGLMEALGGRSAINERVLIDDDEETVLEDLGVRSILETMVAQRSAVLVASTRECGHMSAATQKIVEGRANERPEDLPRNTVNLFG